MSAAAIALLDEYGRSHQHPINKTIHWICVPLIYWSGFALLWSIPNASWLEGFRINWAIIVLALAQSYYFSLAPRLGFGMLVMHVGMIAITSWLAMTSPLPLWALALAVFALAWAGQFIGHHIEGKKPSFFNDLQFLLIGPVWLLGFIYRRAGWRY